MQIPKNQLPKVKKKVEKTQIDNDPAADMESFLLKAPAFSKQQLEAIAQTRKAINESRIGLELVE